jgi:predicted O-methyltransferase YrrM
VGRFDARVLRQSGRWLVRSREHTNLTYDLTELNEEHLAWFVSRCTGVPVSTARNYLLEARNDHDLADHVSRWTSTSGRSRLADSEVRLGRRAGWYAIVRALQPSHVVETGTDKGLGSCVIAAALLRNGSGRLTTIDINPESGYLIAGQYGEVVDRVIGDSVSVLSDLAPIDLLLHDSNHTAEHELAEFDAAALSETSVVLSDNARDTRVLPDWAERRGWQFLAFYEQPLDHWYPGGGIGLARRGGRSLKT